MESWAAEIRATIWRGRHNRGVRIRPKLQCCKRDFETGIMKLVPSGRRDGGTRIFINLFQGLNREVRKHDPEQCASRLGSILQQHYFEAFRQLSSIK